MMKIVDKKEVINDVDLVISNKHIYKQDALNYIVRMLKGVNIDTSSIDINDLSYNNIHDNIRNIIAALDIPDYMVLNFDHFETFESATITKNDIVEMLKEFKEKNPMDSVTTNDLDYFNNLLKHIVDVDNMFEDCGLATVDDILNAYNLDMEQLNSKMEFDYTEEDQEFKDCQKWYKHDQEQKDLWYNKLCSGQAPYMYVPVDETYTPMYKWDFADRIINYLK